MTEARVRSSADMRLREFQDAWEGLDAAYTDPAVCEAKLRELHGLIEPLLVAVHVLFRQMNVVDNAAYLAAIVASAGDTDVAGDLWYERYGGDFHAQVHDHLNRIADGPRYHGCVIDEVDGGHQARCCAMRCKWRSDPFASEEEAGRAGDDHRAEMQPVEAEQDRLGQ